MLRKVSKICVKILIDFLLTIWEIYLTLPPTAYLILWLPWGGGLETIKETIFNPLLLLVYLYLYFLYFPDTSKIKDLYSIQGS